MPVFHFVLRAYGRWHPDHPTGWNQHGDLYRRATNIPLARYRRKSQRWPSAEFPPATHLPLLAMTRDICLRRAWHCHAVAITESHIHIVASWPNTPHLVDQLCEAHVQATLKRLLALTAAKLTSAKPRRWFSDGAKPRRVRNLAHLHWLKNDYLPKQGGLHWTEPDTPTPQPPQ